MHFHQMTEHILVPTRALVVLMLSTLIALSEHDKLLLFFWPV